MTTTYNVFAIGYAPSQPQTVPALSGWSLCLLAGLLAGAALLTVESFLTSTPTGGSTSRT